MCRNGAEPDNARGVIDRSGLHRRDLMLAQGLAHNVEATLERRIAK
jgi:hypothetical protein